MTMSRLSLFQRLHQLFAVSYNENPIGSTRYRDSVGTGTIGTYRVQHPSLVEVICDGHDILVEVVELHFGKAEHNVTQFGTVVYLPL